jgi:hypothetical protein
VAPPGRGRVRAADRLRERGEPAARAWHGAPARRSRCGLRSGAERGRSSPSSSPRASCLAAIGGVLGVVLAKAAPDRDHGAHAARSRCPSEADVRLSRPVLLFTLRAVAPRRHPLRMRAAWQATRSELVETLKEAGRSSSAACASGCARVRDRGGRLSRLTLLSGGGTGRPRPRSSS